MSQMKNLTEVNEVVCALKGKENKLVVVPFSTVEGFKWIEILLDDGVIVAVSALEGNLKVETRT